MKPPPHLGVGSRCVNTGVCSSNDVLRVFPNHKVGPDSYNTASVADDKWHHYALSVWQEDTVLYKWTKDTIENKDKKIKYMKSFTIYVKSEQLYKKDVANRIEKKLLNLNCECILKVNKYDSNPKNNPQPPKKYFN